jgi:hypothetical protein
MACPLPSRPPFLSQPCAAPARLALNMYGWHGSAEEEARGRPITRVNVPGGTGGTSRISFGDDPPAEAARLSTRTNRPGGTGGASSITLGQDGADSADVRTPR